MPILLQPSSRWKRHPAAMPWVLIATLAVAHLFLASCASRQVRLTPANVAVPVISGEHGIVDEAEARQIITKLASQAPDSEAFSEVLVTVAALSSHTMYKDNRSELLIDGPSTYQAMLGSMERAKRFIYLETFAFSDDEIGQEFREALSKQAQQGIDVYVIYDSVGSADSHAQFFEDMQKAGIKVLEFHKINPLTGGSLFGADERDHRKLMVVDGEVAFTGGVNISRTYSNSSPQVPEKKKSLEEGWRDTHIQIYGPAARGFQSAFQNHWRSQDGAGDNFDHYTAEPMAAGDELVAVLQTRGDDGEGSSIYTAYIEAMEAAQERIWITQAYFSPDREFLHQLAAAAERGVDVRVLVPRFSDSTLVMYASESHYGDLLEAGVKIYQRTSSVLHAKTAVIDGIWSTVGSSNLDYRSFLHNDELNAVVFGTRFGKQMEDQYRADLKDSKILTLQAWRERPIRNRLKELFSRLFQYWI